MKCDEVAVQRLLTGHMAPEDAHPEDIDATIVALTGQGVTVNAICRRLKVGPARVRAVLEVAQRRVLAGSR